MTIAVLGPVALDGDESALSPRDRVVLAALVTRRGEAISVETLADVLWGDRPPASAAKVVQGCVLRLRRELGQQAIRTSPQGYRLTVPADQVDVRRFERLVGRARELSTLGEYERAAYAAGEALALWRGRPLEVLDGWDEGRTEAERLGGLRLDAEDLRLDAALRAGRYRDVLVEAQAAVAAAPLREQRWAVLATAQYRCGQQADALRSLQRARTMLLTELGLDPGPELTALEQAILRQDPALDSVPEPREPETACPYRGLVAYDVSDADAFFGRAIDVATCLDRLAVTGVLVVAGASGSGKSSLVRAGVAAALRRAGEQVVIVTPGAHPMDALTAVPAGRRCVLVVDQLEEVSTLCVDPAEREQFFAALLALSDRHQLVLALRADRMGDLAAHPDFSRRAEPGLYLLGPLAEANLREAIEGPARQAGLQLERGLADLMVEEVLDEPGALPLLSHALRRTWERREGRTLTVEGYRAAGGIRGAIAQSAEQVYEQVPAEDRRLLRDVLLRLVTATTGEPAAVRLPRRVLAADQARAAMVERLVAARLVTADGDTVQVAHEAVFRAWPRLRDWLDEDVAGQRLLRHLAAAADTWRAMDRPDSELYRGARLEQAQSWREAADPDLTEAETEFLDASAALADAQRVADVARARQKERTNRRLRALLAALTVLLVFALAAGVLAARQAHRADAAATSADARRVGAQALVAEDLDRSLLLAVEGARLDPSPDTQANLLAALSRSPEAVASIRGQQQWSDVAVIPGGGLTAVEVNGPARFYDGGSRREIGKFDAFTVSGVAVRPSGDQVAIGAQISAVDLSDTDLHGYDVRPLRLVDPTTFAELPTRLGGLPQGSKLVTALAYSADSRFLAAHIRLDDPETNDQIRSVVAVWDLTAPDRPVRSINLPPNGYEVALSPDGRVVYTARADPPQVTAFDVRTGSRIATTSRAGGALALSADGTQLAATDGPDILLLDPTTLAVRTRLRGHTEAVGALTFVADGSRIASGADDRTVAVWDTATGDQLEVLRGHTGAITALAVDPDKGMLWSASLDGAVLGWDLEGDQRLAPRQNVTDAMPVGNEGLALATADGTAFAYYRVFNRGTGQAASIQFVEASTHKAGPVIDTKHRVFGAISWRPDGASLATTGTDGFVRLWDRHTGKLVAERRVATAHLSGIDYAGDGVLVVSERDASLLHVLDADTLRPLRTPIRLRTPPVLWAFASPDGRWALTLTQSGYALTDLRAGTVTKRGEAPYQPSWADFSPDGKRAAVGLSNGAVGVLDTADGEWVRQPVVGHRGYVATTAYSPDGDRVVSGGADGDVSLWNGRTGAFLGSFHIGSPQVQVAAAFAQDGHTVLAMDMLGTVARWDTRPDSWIRHACRVAGRSLTTSEWRDAFGDRRYQPACSPKQ